MTPEKPVREGYRGRKVLVVGLGLSGIAASRLLRSRGAFVTAADRRMRDELTAEALALEAEGVFLHLGSHPPELLSGVDLVVASPGVRTDSPILAEARARGVPVWGELELGFREIRGIVAAVTGTKGKSTTSSLLAAMLRASGRDTRLAGNIGAPLVRELTESSEHTVFVLEVSSFQLETIESFRPHVAVLLDVTPDHLDWHPGFDAYTAAKARLFENQREEDTALVFGGNPLTVSMAERAKSKKWYFDLDCLGTRESLLPHVHMEGPWIVKHESGATEALASLEEFQLVGRHNRLNAMAASAAAALLGVSGEEIEDALIHFQGLPHALEKVAEVEGVRFYNDSKATNVQAVAAALESFDGGILLILGGRFKGGDLRHLRDLVARKVKRVFAIGESRDMVREALAGTAPIEMAKDLESAVESAHRSANRGDVVLLSPAGSSFDMFRDYRERGERFRAAVARLAAGRQ
jgi:UDP-N-acetylmuramoylalanine--D-glutamate ligase